MSQQNLLWEDAALVRLKRVPFFIRPFVKSRVEKIARLRSLETVSEALLIEIKQKEMPK